MDFHNKAKMIQSTEYLATLIIPSQKLKIISNYFNLSNLAMEKVTTKQNHFQEQVENNSLSNKW